MTSVFLAVGSLRVLAGVALERRDLDTAERLTKQALSMTERRQPSFEFLALPGRSAVHVVATIETRGQPGGRAGTDGRSVRTPSGSRTAVAERSGAKTQLTGTGPDHLDDRAGAGAWSTCFSCAAMPCILPGHRGLCLPEGIKSGERG